uniref:Tetratricopeptide repeat-containing protein n=1 Tax=Candidatus Kentrum sp. DK TaxID=2126562 RepID=A0A450S4C5_9GAMM|nr:MAG: Tetratricopeptide repeat-containing protein [Candidatus Kentron sp. DK]
MNTNSNTKNPGYSLIHLAALILVATFVSAAEDPPSPLPAIGPEEVARIDAPVVTERGGTRANGEAPSGAKPIPPAPFIIDAIENRFRAEAGREPEPEEIVAALNRSTLGLLRDGKYRLAERVACVALDLAQWRLWDDHPQTLISINNLATVYSIRGRFHRAELLLGPALETSEQVLGKEHPNTLTTLDSLAFLYDAQGLYGRAEPLLARALATRQRTLGDKHADTRNSLVNLARLYFAQGRYREAESLHARVLETTAQALGETHPDTLSAQLALAIVYVARRKFGPALAKLRWMNARMGEIAGAEPRAGRQRWRRLRSDLHNVVLSLARMVLPADVRQDALGLVADVLLTPRRWKKKIGEMSAYLARVPPEGGVIASINTAAWPENWRQRQEIVCVGGKNEENPSRQSTRITYRYRDDSAIRGLDWRGIGASLGVDLADGESGGGGETPAPLPVEPEGNPERPAGDSWRIEPGLPILQPVGSEPKSTPAPDSALLRLCAFQPIDFATGKTGRWYWLELQALLDQGNEARISLRDRGAVMPIEPVSEPGRAEVRGIGSEKIGPPGVRLPPRWPDTMPARYRNVYVVLDVR